MLVIVVRSSPSSNRPRRAPHFGEKAPNTRKQPDAAFGPYPSVEAAVVDRKLDKMWYDEADKRWVDTQGFAFDVVPLVQPK